MGMSAPATVVNRAVIDAEAYPAGRIRRPEGRPWSTGRSGAPDSPDAQQRAERQSNILAFADRVAQRLREQADYQDFEGESGNSWTAKAAANFPASPFLAQHIAQEQLSTGLTLDPHRSATSAYARSGALGAASSLGILRIAV